MIPTFEGAVTDAVVAQCTTYTGSENAMTFNGRILDAIRDVFDDFEVPEKEVFVELVSDLYDRYIQPLNLPGPDVVLDPIVRAALIGLASRLYDSFFEEDEEEVE